MRTNSRVILADYYGYPAQHYHATFDHLTHKRDAHGNKVPVALLTDLYLVDSNDNRLENVRQDTYISADGQSIIADHVWVEFNKTWFNTPHELLQGDQVFFKADVEQYKISRADVVSKRQAIWKDAQAMNDQVYSAWQGSKHNLHGTQYQSAYEQMRAHIQSNNEMARIKQQSIPLVDYSLTNVQNLKVIKYLNKSVLRTKYSYYQYSKQGYKYSAWLAARSMAFVNTGNIF